MSTRSSLYKYIHEKWLTWNMFNSRSTDPTIKHQEILSTRLYFILIIISFSILTTYISISIQTKNTIIPFPTQSMYENLQKQYPNNLQCPCNKTVILYKTFVKIIPSFHQVCSSDFISQQWIDFIFQVDSTLIYPIDIRTSLSSMWQLIKSFCQSATMTIFDRINQFYNSFLIEPMLLTEQVLEAKIQTILYSLFQMTLSNFIQSIEIVYRITQVNQFITGLLTNYIAITKEFTPINIYYPEYTIGSMTISSYIGMIENEYIFKDSSITCSCKINRSCPLSGNIYSYNRLDKLGIYNMKNIHPNTTLPGLIVDCLPIQMLFSSTLECFYNQTCLNILLSFYSNQINISILNPSLSTRFDLTTKMKLILNELFIEEIFNETNYKKYYFECKPMNCHYNYSSRLDWISILTILFGLLGGITSVLRIITPFIIQLIFFIKKRFFSKSIQQVKQNQTIRIRLKHFYQFIEMKTFNLNIYNQHSHDKNRVYHGILSTWLYIILFLISICIIILFSDLSNQTIKKTILNPSIEQYKILYKQYSTKLTCPCTQISIPFEDFIKLQVNYHQICSSDFIKSSWYENFPSSLSFHYLEEINFFLIASSYFQTLSTFCEFANTTINDAIQRFSNIIFVNSQLLSNDSFIQTIDSFINTFIESTRNEFQYQMLLINISLHANHYVSNIKLSTHLYPLISQDQLGKYHIDINIYELLIHSLKGKLCRCIRDSVCNINFKMYFRHHETNINWEVEGIQGGCSVLDSVFKSSMICLFKNSCLNRLQLLISKLIDRKLISPKILNRTLFSQYSLDTSIKTIIDEMMIEYWNISYSFDKFYYQCKPLSCSFIYEKKTDIVYIITIIISLIGGINIILRLISPILIKIIFKFIKSLQIQIRNDHHHSNRICIRIRNLINELKNQLLMLNIFDSESNDIEINRRERITTRIYLIIFSITIYIITIYTIYSNININKIILNPSENEYNQLLISYSNSLDCPCKKISIEYKYFIEINTRIHSICSSDFVKKEWINYLSPYLNFVRRNRRDVRQRGHTYFTFLSSICQLSQRIIKNAIDQFHYDTYINIQLISKSDFHNQIHNIILQFQNVTLIKFSRNFKLIRDILNGNAFISSHSLNWEWWRDLTRIFYTLPTRPIIMNDGCSCGTRSDCTESAGIYDEEYTNQEIFSIPGWNIGCSVIETVLYSSLECFFEQNCTELLLLHIAENNNENPRINVSIIDSSLKSRFPRNIRIENIIDQLFVEEWKTDISYSSFYNQCAPISCTYQIERENYFLYTASKILGLYGGLSLTLRFTIPIIIKIIFQIRNRCQRNTIIPTE